MADNYALNPTAGFKAYRDAYQGLPGSLAALREKALSTHGLDRLRQDALDGTLPQVSWICPTKAGSEHPSPSSPAQGADYVARVLDALTANPQVWSRTVLLLMFDENDGFFDHMPPPAPPSRDARGGAGRRLDGDTRGEYHEIIAGVESDDTPAHRHGVYGLGPRVPMYALSPWSRGGWVNSQVFDHTSVLRFIEQRFGVAEPNISPWRRAVCGDLTSLFDFSASEPAVPEQPCRQPPRGPRAAALPGTATPTAPDQPPPARQQPGLRPSRALPYALHAHATARDHALTLRLDNPARPAPCCMSTTGCIWSADHGAIPSRPASAWTASGTRRRTTAAMTCGCSAPTVSIATSPDVAAAGAQAAPDIQASYDAPGARLRLTLTNPANAPSSSISRTPPMGNARRRVSRAPRRNAIGTSAAWAAGTTAPSR